MRFGVNPNQPGTTARCRSCGFPDSDHVRRRSCNGLARCARRGNRDRAFRGDIYTFFFLSLRFTDDNYRLEEVVLGAGVAVSRFDQGQNPFYFAVCCCCAGDSVIWGEGDAIGEV